MNKTELCDKISEKENLPRAQANRVVELIIETIISTLKSGDEVALTGFGTFSAKNRAARQGVNPKTGEKLQIPAMTVPKFKAGKFLKDALK
ncbi:MAG: DNA-binding protein HU-beta [Parcubacteria group bacterium Athens1014_10]|nr:MAG: DNA-binding protein HU-beta [Parcubacteria group bacterium Athens1014_10]TSD05196.1 MAG: DNA-binding protein HU-beta [Parcubacteria group bacterium Athens0714_12]